MLPVDPDLTSRTGLAECDAADRRTPSDDVEEMWEDAAVTGEIVAREARSLAGPRMAVTGDQGQPFGVRARAEPRESARGELPIPVAAGDELLGVEVVDLSDQQGRGPRTDSPTGEKDRGVLVAITGKEVGMKRLVVGARHAQPRPHRDFSQSVTCIRQPRMLSWAGRQFTFRSDTWIIGAPRHSIGCSA